MEESIRYSLTVTSLQYVLRWKYQTLHLQEVLQKDRGHVSADLDCDDWQVLTGVCLTLGTCGLNSTALCMASTAFISAVLKPRLDAASGENLQK